MHLIQFLVNFFGSIIDKDLRKNLIKELSDTSVNMKKMDEVFKSVKQRLKMN